MKHIIIDAVIFGLQKSGGISRTWSEVLSGFEEANPNFKITLLVPNNQNIEWQDLKPNLKRTRILKRRRFRWGKTGFWQDSLYLTALALRLKPDVWHSSFFVGMPLKFCKTNIISYHDMIPEKLKIATPYETQMKKLCLKYSDIILSASSHSKKDLLETWPELQPKVTVLLQPCPKISKPILSSKEKEPYLLFVGKRKGYKNFLPTVKTILAANQFSHLKIISVGGEENLSEEEMELFKDPRLEKRGVVTSSEIHSLIAGCEALLFPSLYEGFGLPVVEAFQLGVPVLAMNFSSIPEVTGPDYPLAEKEDPLSVVKTLDKLLNERVKWSEFGKARSLLFSREKMVQFTLKVYQNA